MVNLSSGKSSKNCIRFSCHTINSVHELIDELKNSSNLEKTINSFTKTVVATREENGNITIKDEENEGFKLDFKFASILSTILMLLIILSLPIKALILVPLIEEKIIGIVFYLIPMFLYICLVVLLILEFRINDGKNGIKNHGAEHMVYAAYMQYKKIPTIYEIRKFSRFYKFCGSSIYSALITGQLIGFIVFLFTGFRISEIILLVVPIICCNCFPFYLIGYVIQIFTTSKPDIENIELAIAALSTLEEKVESDKQLADM